MRKQKCDVLYKRDSYYHIYNRGHRKTNIFRCNKDFKRFEETIKRFLRKYDIVLISYCLMPNHYHLVLKLGINKMDISKFMQRSMTSYANYFNRKYGLVGALFQGRFDARRLENDIDLFNMIKYLKDNPFEAGLTYRNGYYKWFYVSRRAMKVVLRTHRELEEMFDVIC